MPVKNAEEQSAAATPTAGRRAGHGSQPDAGAGDHLSASQHESREQTLTRSGPARVRTSTVAIVLKHGDLFLLATERGEVPWDLPHGLGLFYRDCRFLDGYLLTLNGLPLTPLLADDTTGYRTSHDLANPEMHDGGQGGRTIAQDEIAVRRVRAIRHDVLHEVLTVRNFGHERASLHVDFRFRSTFEDIFLLRGYVQAKRGTELPVEHDKGMIRLRYEGRDHLLRATTIVFEPPPDRADDGSAGFDVTLDSGETYEIAIVIQPSIVADGHDLAAAPRPSSPGDVARRLDHAKAAWVDRSTSLSGSNPLFDRVLHRALVDASVLRSMLSGLHYFAAGIPWYATLFGRDSAIAALQTLPYHPATAKSTLQLLARYQATTEDRYRQAEPGKILHELRRGELAHLQAIPQSPAYYGSVDSTLLFLMLLAGYVNWSGDLDLARALRHHVDAALDWIERYGDHDGDGYVDYTGQYSKGLVNQGWKDSGDAIVNRDGTLAEPPIALAEVQGYTFRAWRQTAGVLRLLGDGARAEDLERKAAALAQRFDRDFWSPDLDCYVLARQRGGRPVEVVASNAGQVLWTGIARPERAAAVARRLLEPDMFSGWGIRTLSSAERRYNPISYHLGSVWPHDNGLILAGFRRYGHDEEALRVFQGIFDAATNLRGYRLPELYAGYDRRTHESRPVRYPVACRPQAWATGAIPHAVWNLLGLRGHAHEGRLDIVRPLLPDWLPVLVLRNLQLGAARVDLRFTRGNGGHVTVEPSVTAGRLDVRVSDAARQPDDWH